MHLRVQQFWKKLDAHQANAEDTAAHKELAQAIISKKEVRNTLSASELKTSTADATTAPVVLHQLVGDWNKSILQGLKTHTNSLNENLTSKQQVHEVSTTLKEMLATQKTYHKTLKNFTQELQKQLQEHQNKQHARWIQAKANTAESPNNTM